MKFLKFWKPLYANTKLSWLKKNIVISSNKVRYRISGLTILEGVTQQYSNKICFFSLKYKTQTNFLKQSRFRLHHELNFNRNHGFFKKI